MMGDEACGLWRRAGTCEDNEVSLAVEHEESKLLESLKTMERCALPKSVDGGSSRVDFGSGGVNWWVSASSKA